MNGIDQLMAIEEIRNLKARYCRGVDQKDTELLLGVFAPDAVADYRGALTDPTTGVPPVRDPAMQPTQGREAIVSGIMRAIAGVVTVHHCANGEITIESEDSASAIWPMVDRLRRRSGEGFTDTTGYGFYHESYVRLDGAWKIGLVKLTRLRVDVVPA